MTQEIDKVIDKYIRGSRGQYFFQELFGNTEIADGYFFRKHECRRALKRQLRQIIADPIILIEYLTQRSSTGDHT
jgi:hypothetical protein